MAMPLVSAQESALPSITLLSGETVEIGTDTRAKKPRYSWVLTKDRQFVNAQRTPFFRARLTEAGRYTLDVNIQDDLQDVTEYRAFTLVVSDQPAPLPPLPPPSTDTTPLLAILTTNPPASSGLIHLPKEGGFLKIDPLESRGKIARYDVDLQLSSDSDGDGNPTNDRDADQTLFSLNGTPLFVYMLPSNDPRSLSLSVRGNRDALFSTIQAPIAFSGLLPSLAPSSSLSSSLASSDDRIFQNQGSPIVIEKRGAVYHFSLALPQELQQRQLLPEWDFGDRTKSLLLRPEHTYLSTGSYPIRLTLRDITTGEILLAITDSLVVQKDVPVQGVSSSVLSSSASSSPSSAKTSFFSSLPWESLFSVALIIFFLLVIASAIFLMLQFVKRKMGQKLADTIETLEQKIVTPSKDAILSTVEPVKLTKSTPVPTPTPALSSDDVLASEEKKTDFTSQTRSNETPLTQSGPVPEWLKKAPSSSSVKESVSDVPPPSTEKKKDTLPPPPIFGKTTPPASPSSSPSSPSSQTPQPAPSPREKSASSPSITPPKASPPPSSPAPTPSPSKEDRPPLIVPEKKTEKPSAIATPSVQPPAKPSPSPERTPPPRPASAVAPSPASVKPPASRPLASLAPSPTPSATSSSVTTPSVPAPSSTPTPSVNTRSRVSPPAPLQPSTPPTPAPSSAPAVASSSVTPPASMPLTASPINPPLKREKNDTPPEQEAPTPSITPSSEPSSPTPETKLLEQPAPAQSVSKPLSIATPTPPVTPPSSIPPVLKEEKTIEQTPVTPAPIESPSLPSDDEPVAFLRMDDVTS